MAELETLDSTECLECSGPPPVFRLPPPPRPPFLTEGTFCSEAPLAELEDCVAIPMIDASYHTNPSLQNTALIITCAVVLLLMAAIVSVVFWKHKRKVQGLLPCKSAAASAAAAASNRRNLAEGQTLQGANTTGSGVLYEDLPETTPHTQLHNHLSVHTGPPTIEVRGKIPTHGDNVPANHHLDYLDYRDPRYVLRANEKPSRAILGGYRTPLALLAKSQGVSQTIATYTPNTPALLSPSVIALQLSNTLDLTSQSNYNVGLDSYESSSITQQTYNHLVNKSTCMSDTVSVSPTIAYTSVNETTSPVSSNVITPTHRYRVPMVQLASEKPFTMEQQRYSANGQRCNRRTSVDSEGYAYVDSANAHKFHNRIDMRNNDAGQKHEYFDVDGYSYLDTGFRKAPGWAKRVATGDATDDEVCPLCTIQQIHQLLGAPEQPYSPDKT